MATRHRTQHIVGVVNWLMSVFSRPPTLRQPASARHQGRRPQIKARKKKDGSVKNRKDCICACPSSGRGPARHQTLRAPAQAGQQRESAHFQAAWEAPTCLTASREDEEKGTTGLWRNRDTASQSSEFPSWLTSALCHLQPGNRL